MSKDARTQYFMQINNKAQSGAITFNAVLNQSGPQNQTVWTCQLTVTIPNYAQRLFVDTGSSQIKAKDAASYHALLWLASFGI
ncbi:hypothetical protein FS837_003118 [Tulasnella sp. UAMH 9824]|nr:hypothetical protein FS837_003118 [Tulasnella sp. UAMH 9824]